MDLLVFERDDQVIIFEPDYLKLKEVHNGLFIQAKHWLNSRSLKTGNFPFFACLKELCRQPTELEVQEYKDLKNSSIYALNIDIENPEHSINRELKRLMDENYYLKKLLSQVNSDTAQNIMDEKTTQCGHLHKIINGKSIIIDQYPDDLIINIFKDGTQIFTVTDSILGSISKLLTFMENKNNKNINYKKQINELQSALAAERRKVGAMAKGLISKDIIQQLTNKKT